MSLMDKIKNTRILRDRYGEGRPIKILMVGGPRCGKTTALSSIFDQMRNGSTNEFLTAYERTDYISKNGEQQDSLIDKKLQLIHFIEKYTNQTFIIDSGPTNYCWDYKLQFKIPGTRKHFLLEFKDVPGEFFAPPKPEKENNDNDKANIVSEDSEKVVGFIQDSDIFIVAVDTPFLMNGTRSVSEAANCKDSIHDLLGWINDQEGRRAKQVIFVPIKCEKWMQEKDGPENIVKKIQEFYSSLIKALEKYQTEISIIPIQTAGSIIFNELKDPYHVVNKQTGEVVVEKCSKYSDRKVLTSKGVWYNIKDNEIIQEDPKATFSGDNRVVKPYTWYSLKEDAEYVPYNCEQLPLHILRFVFNKFKSETGDGFSNRLGSKIFGSITVNDMQECLNKLSKANLIKDNVEGIKTIKKCF